MMHGADDDWSVAGSVVVAEADVAFVDILLKLFPDAGLHVR
jgi:hypothetical protein